MWSNYITQPFDQLRHAIQGQLIRSIPSRPLKNYSLYIDINLIFLQRELQHHQRHGRVPLRLSLNRIKPLMPNFRLVTNHHSPKTHETTRRPRTISWERPEVVRKAFLHYFFIFTLTEYFFYFHFLFSFFIFISRVRIANENERE